MVETACLEWKIFVRYPSKEYSRIRLPQQPSNDNFHLVDVHKVRLAFIFYQYLPSSSNYLKKMIYLIYFNDFL